MLPQFSMKRSNNAAGCRTEWNSGRLKNLLLGQVQFSSRYRIGWGTMDLVKKKGSLSTDVVRHVCYIIIGEQIRDVDEDPCYLHHPCMKRLRDMFPQVTFYTGRKKARKQGGRQAGWQAGRQAGTDRLMWIRAKSGFLS
jgi:hypothetical protein